MSHQEYTHTSLMIHSQYNVLFNNVHLYLRNCIKVQTVTAQQRFEQTCTQMFISVLFVTNGSKRTLTFYSCPVLLFMIPIKILKIVVQSKYFD